MNYTFKSVSALCFVYLFSLHITLAQQSVLSAGGNATGSNGSVSFSVGQVFFHSFEGDGGTISEGVQQPYEIFVITSAEDLAHIKLEMAAYPNPVSNRLTLQVDLAGDISTGKLQYQLFDMQGRLLLSERITDTHTSIDMDFLEPAIYFLNVFDESQRVKTFKVIKK